MILDNARIYEIDRIKTTLTGKHAGIIIDLIDTIRDFQSRLAQAEEQTKLEVTASMMGVIELYKCFRCRGTGKPVRHGDKVCPDCLGSGSVPPNKDSVSALIPSDSASLYERRMNEARIDEHMQFCADCIVSLDGKFIPCNRVARLRRATAGKGQENA
jgi:uncharacterized phage protein